MTIEIRAPEECAYDAVSLGEVMLRLDPGEGRIRTARQFRVWEGGGEYNVARGLARCFGLRTAVVTSLVDNEVGRLVEGLVLAGGVDPGWITWVADDGIGRDVRNGLNFTERGFGVRGAKGVSDRGRSAASQLRPGDTDWEHLFGTLGVRWFHTGGIFAGLSAGTADVVVAAMEAARRHGTVVSYDLNYRPSLWGSVGGPARARQVNARIAGLVDVLIGNEEDFTAALGYAVEGATPELTELRPEAYGSMLAAVARSLPQLRVAAVTLRKVHSASRNDWGALAWSADDGLVQATQRDGLEILDRIGGGRQLRVRARLRAAGRSRPRSGGGVRRCSRSPGHDHPRRHLDGEPRRGRGAGARRRCPRPEVRTPLVLVEGDRSALPQAR